LTNVKIIIFHNLTSVIPQKNYLTLYQ